MSKKADSKDAKISDVGSSDKKSGLKLHISIQSLFFVLILIAAIGSAGYFWNESRIAKQQTPEAIEERNQVETQEVIASLSSVLLIDSETEEPTVARVEDQETLKQSNQEFYKDVQIGDYLILYPQRAIIYRLNEKKIINVAPILDTSSIPAQEQTISQPEVTTEDGQP